MYILKSTRFFFYEVIYWHNTVITATQSCYELEDFQGDLHQVTNWIQRHGLTPNHQKTQYLPISQSKNGPRLTISLNGQTIDPSSEVKYLGVTLTPNLSWSTHIENISKSSKQLLGREYIGTFVTPQNTFATRYIKPLYSRS